MEWEKVFANHISDKKLIFKIYELFYSVMRRKGNIATCNNMRTLKAKYITVSPLTDILGVSQESVYFTA